MRAARWLAARGAADAAAGTRKFPAGWRSRMPPHRPCASRQVGTPRPQAGRAHLYPSLHKQALHHLAVAVGQAGMVQADAKLQGVPQAGVLDQRQVLVQVVVYGSAGRAVCVSGGGWCVRGQGGAARERRQRVRRRTPMCTRSCDGVCAKRCMP